jgi:anti-anti-sigma factor
VGNVVVLDLQGNFFGDQETDELQTAIMNEANAGNARMVLNLAECHALNSMSIGVLMRGIANYRSRGGEIKLCALSKRIKDLFAMIGIGLVFDRRETEEEAIASFVVEAK